MSRLVLTVTLSVGGTLLVLGCAQGLERRGPVGSPSKTVSEVDSTAHFGAWGRGANDSLLWSPDSVVAVDQARTEAYEAAGRDPGILMYTEPPPGTATPVYTPPDSVDPGIIRPPSP